MVLAAKDPEERRRRILVAAVRVLKDRGFEGTRVADIAAAAGTSSGLVVYHFGSLDGALAAALASVEDAFYEELEARSGPEQPPWERLVAAAELAADSGPALGDWRLWMEVWVRALRDEQTATLRRVMDARWRALLREIVRSGVAEGVFECADPKATAVRLAALMDGLAVQVALGDPSVPRRRMARLWLDAAAAELAHRGS